jgi:hypothetical protein
VVGVRASKVFCLHYLSMNTVGPPSRAPPPDLHLIYTRRPRPLGSHPRDLARHQTSLGSAVVGWVRSLPPACATPAEGGGDPGRPQPARPPSIPSQSGSDPGLRPTQDRRGYPGKKPRSLGGVWAPGLSLSTDPSRERGRRERMCRGGSRIATTNHKGPCSRRVVAPNILKGAAERGLKASRGRKRQRVRQPSQVASTVP